MQKKKKNKPEQNYCRKCERTISIDNFYEATNHMLDTNGYMSVCKRCVNDIYVHYFSIYNNIDTAIQCVCRDIDVRYSEAALSHTQSHIDKLLSQGRSADAVFGYYKSKLGSVGKLNEGYDSFRYIDSDMLDEKYNVKLSIEKEKDVISDEVIKYWGEGRTPWEYNYLEDEIYKMKGDFECSDYGMEMIMKDICFMNLEIEKLRMSSAGSSKEVTKLIEARAKLMTDGNLKPVQSTGADRTEKMSLGMFIKKWEDEKPIEKRLNNEMKEYIDTFFIGHLAKMEGLDNEMVKKYEDAISEYTVDIESISPEEDEL